MLEYVLCSVTVLPTYEDGTDSVFRNVGIYNSDAGDYPEESIQHAEYINTKYVIHVKFFFLFLHLIPFLFLPKRRHTKFRRRRIIQKKAYDMQNI